MGPDFVDFGRILSCIYGHQAWLGLTGPRQLTGIACVSYVWSLIKTSLDDFGKSPKEQVEVGKALCGSDSEPA